MTCCDVHTEGHSKEWNERAIALIERRRQQFQERPCDHCCDEAPAIKQEVVLSDDAVENLLSKRVLEIPELLENILSHADILSQLRACNVSTFWRSTMESVFRLRYPTSSKLQGVQYGYLQRLDSPAPWLHITEEELATFETQVANLDHDPRSPRVFFPARLTQSSQVPESTTTAVHDYYKVIWSVDDYWLPGPQWLDFTQFQFSPCFWDLFQDRIKITSGACEISLRSDACPEHMLLDPSIDQTLLDKMLGSIFFTDPPCKTLGIYFLSCHLSRYGPGEWDDNPNFGLYVRMRDNEGIRVSQLLSTLKDATQALNKHWGYLLWEMQDHLKARPIKKFAAEDWLHLNMWKTWKTSATPKLILIFDKQRMRALADYNGHYSRSIMIATLTNAQKYEEEWLALPYAAEYVDCKKNESPQGS